MKVYVVFSDYIHYDGDGVLDIKTHYLTAIFKTEKKAQEYINSKSKPDEYKIEEWEVE